MTIMKGNYSSKILLLLICFLFFNFGRISAQSAEIFFGSQGQEIGIEQKFEVGVFLNTQGQEINAIEARIIFPKELLLFLEIRDGESILPFWIKRPGVPEAQKTGELFFSGVIPGGFNGKDGYLFSIIFLAKKTGSPAVATNNEKILLNDGRGTLAEVKKTPLALQIKEQKGGEEYIPPYDLDPPEPFTSQISRSPYIFDGKWFLAFATQDKGSGIDHYEIQETRKKQPEPEKWVIGESPYVLKDQILRSFIFVRAVDKAGNERIAVLSSQRRVRWYTNYLIWAIIILGGVIIYILGRILWKKVHFRK